MAKMTFVCEHPHLFKSNVNLAKITYESNRDCLDEILEDFEDFLRGAGFTIDGTLQIFQEEVSEEPKITINTGNTTDTIALDNGDTLSFPDMNSSMSLSYDDIITITTSNDHNDYYYDINRNR